MSLQSASRGPNSSPLSNENSSNSIELHQQQQSLISDNQTKLLEHECTSNIYINETYRPSFLY